MAGYLSDTWGLSTPGQLTKIVDGQAQAPITISAEAGWFFLCVDHDGIPWLGRQTFSGTTGTVIKVVDGVPSSPMVTSQAGLYMSGMCVDKDNNILIIGGTTTRGITRIINGVPQAQILTPNGCKDFCMDRDNNIWIINDTGIQKIINGVLQDTIVISDRYLVGICVDLDNNVWVKASGVDGAENSGVIQVINGVPQTLIQTGLGKAQSSKVCVDRHNNIWTPNGRENKIYRITGGVAQAVITNTPSTPDEIWTDRDNAIWVSCPGAGAGVVTRYLNGVLSQSFTTGNNMGNTPYNYGDGTGMKAALMFDWVPNDSVLPPVTFF
jgi:hypothetical protein